MALNFNNFKNVKLQTIVSLSKILTLIWIKNMYVIKLH
jgi:hypothetical protein